MCYKYIRVQLIPDNPNSLQKQTSDLKKFVKLLGTQMRVHTIPYKDTQDTFLIDIPEDTPDDFYLINAVAAYCYFYDIPWRLASDRVTAPFDKFLKSLADED